MKSTILLALFPLWLFAQPHLDPDIRGTWKGYVKTSDKKINYELVVGEKAGALTAYSKIIFNNNGVEYFAIKSVLVKKDKERFVFEEDQLLSDNFKEDAPKKIRQINTLEMNNGSSEMVLSGTFKTRPVKELRVATGDISISKSPKPDSAGLYSELTKLGLVKDFTFNASDPIEEPSTANQDQLLTSKPSQIVTPVNYTPENTIATGVIAQSEMNVTVPLPEADLILDNKYIAASTIPFSPSFTKILSIKKLKTKNIVVKAPPLRSKSTTIPNTTKAQAPVLVKTNTPAVKPSVKTSAPLTPPAPATPVASKPTEKTAITAPVATPVVAKPTPIKQAIAPGSASELEKRKIETIETVFFDNDSLKLTLYDNGEVDGDTVSVVVNGKVFMGKKGLSTNAITETLYITPELGDSLQMIMYAENLGSIGKNTGLLIVQDGKERHEIRFSGDLTKNAAVIFKRRK